MVIWDLSGPKRFLEGIVQSLSGNKHVCIILPVNVLGMDPIVPLGNLLETKRLGSLTTVSVGPDVNEDPFKALVAALGLDDSRIKSTQTLLQQVDVPSKFIVLNGTDQGNEKRIANFSKLLSEIGQTAQSLTEIPFQLITLIKGTTPCPEEDLFLSIHEWWGVISQPDVDTKIRHFLDEFPPISVGDYYWKLSLSKGLCGTDIDLAQRIIEENPKDFENIVRVLNDYWVGGYLDFNNFEPDETFLLLGSTVAGCPKEFKKRKLWSDGWLDWKDGSGQMVHSSLLASVDCKEEIERRIWSTQLEIFLPVVDKVRRKVLAWLEKEYGQSWICQLTSGLGEDDEERICSEIGPLAYHVFRYGSVFHRYHPQSTMVSDVVWKWRNIRNELSHGRFVDFQEIDEAIRAYKRFARC